MVPIKLARLRTLVTQLLGDRHLAVERFEDYCFDLERGLISPVRLSDFLSGLHAAGCWSGDQDDDVCELFEGAFPLAVSREA